MSIVKYRILMDIIAVLKEDYQRFPLEQTYSIYDEQVYFKDPMNEFRGVGRYKKMIHFIKTLFQDIHMELHSISRQENTIKTEWTLYWTSPLPWKPRIAIPGRSELRLNEGGLIISHLDYWHCSRFSVLQQHFVPTAKTEK